MINLISNIYLSQDANRREELINIITRNCDSKANVIPVIGPDITYEELSHINWNGKLNNIKMLDHIPTFKDLFNCCRPEDFNIVANSDIIFIDQDLDLIIENLRPQECYALTRYDMIDDKIENAHFLDRIDSQDAWCFKGMPPEVYSDFLMGIPGCDNRIAHEIMTAGWRITNPSLSIKSYHYHVTQARTRAKIVGIPGPYKVLTPHFL